MAKRNRVTEYTFPFHCQNFASGKTVTAETCCSNHFVITRSFAGDLEDFASHSRSRGAKNREAVISAMQEVEWISCGEVATKTKLTDRTVRRHLNDLLADKIIAETGQGKLTRYQLSGQSQENA